MDMVFLRLFDRGYVKKTKKERTRKFLSATRFILKRTKFEEKALIRAQGDGPTTMFRAQMDGPNTKFRAQQESPYCINRCSSLQRAVSDKQRERERETLKSKDRRRFHLVLPRKTLAVFADKPWVASRSQLSYCNLAFFFLGGYHCDHGVGRF